MSHIGIFSCDACDHWRTKDICGRRILKSHDELKSFFCTRSSKGYGPIRIHVVFGEDAPNNTLIEEDDKENVHMEDDKKIIYRKQRGPKQKALKPSFNFSPPDPCAVPSNDAALKSETAANIEVT